MDTYRAAIKHVLRARHFFAAALALFGGEQASIHFSVNRHLLAGHRVEGKARADFRDAARAFDDHDEVNDDENEEDQKADGKIAGGDELTKSLDDLPRCIRTLMTMGQHDTGGGHIQRQAHDCGKEQDSGEGGEFERAEGI